MGMRARYAGLQGISFLLGFKSYGKLIRMIISVVGSLQYFIVILTVIVAGFAMANMSLQSAWSVSVRTFNLSSCTAMHAVIIL